MKCTTAALAFSLVVAAARAEAAAEPELARLFPFAADVFVPEGGLARLELPDAVLAESRAELADVRIVDRDGREVPFLVDPGSELDLEARWSTTAKVLDVDREQSAREGLPAATLEEYELAWPERAPTSAPLELVVEAGPKAFVRSVSVAARRSGALSLLVGDRSLTRLASSETELRSIPLPPFAGESIVVRIRGEEGFYLEPSFRFQSSHVRRADERSVFPLRILSQRHEDDRTIVEVERPGGVAPSGLRIGSSTPSFDRRVEVFDVGSASDDDRLGEGRLLRAGARRPVESRDVDVRPARGTRLRVVIHDGSSPPLAGLDLAALVRRPALLFPVRPAGEGPAATLYFGGGRAGAPRYDLASLLPDPSVALVGERAEIAARLRDSTELVSARLGPVRPNPQYDREPVLAFAMRAGAAIDPRLFAKLRRLVVPASPEGLSHLALSPEDLTLARADLADFRIVDRESRQWPYLLDRDGTPSWVELEVERTSDEDRSSVYRLRPTQGPITIDAVRLSPRGTFFDRAYELVGVTEDGRRTVASGRLQGRRDAREITIPLPETRLEALELTVADGDDAPLDLGAVARVHLPRLYLAAPPGEYVLLFGDDSSAPPSYDLDRARDMVRAVRSAPVTASAVEENPEFRSFARLFSPGSQRPLLQRALLWAAIILAVSALLFLTLRLARSGRDDAA